MVSKVCSRSQGHPPGARSRAMIDTSCSNFSPALMGIFYCTSRALVRWALARVSFPRNTSSEQFQIS